MIVSPPVRCDLCNRPKESAHTLLCDTCGGMVARLTSACHRITSVPDYDPDFDAPVLRKGHGSTKGEDQ